MARIKEKRSKKAVDSFALHGERDCGTSRYNLEGMLESINDENLHEEFDLGRPVGNEIIPYEA